MKSEKKLKEYETVWTCDFCGEEFKTKKESDQHELICKKNPKNNEIIFRIKKPSGFLIFGFVSNISQFLCICLKISLNN